MAQAQIKMNKASRLKHNLKGDATDMVDFLRSTRSDTSPRISGRNKALGVGRKRQINCWFKQQLFSVDCLNRQQNTAYESYKFIEREKTNLEKSRPKSEWVPAESKEHEQEDTSEDVHNRPSHQILKNLTNFGKLEPTNVPEDKNMRGNKNGENKLNKRHGVNFNELPSITRPQTSDGIPEVKNTNNIKDKPGTAKSMSMLSSHFPSIGRGKKGKHGGNTLQEQSSHWWSGYKRAKDLDDPLFYYVKTADGEIVPSELPYRRRVFPPPIPDEEELNHRSKMLIEMEMRAKEKISNKYQHLIGNLDRLEKFDPLAELKATEAADQLRRKALEERQWRTDALGSMGKILGAYSKEWMLDGVDPDSEEAFKLIEYLRTNSPTSMGKLLEKLDIPYSERGRNVT